MNVVPLTTDERLGGCRGARLATRGHCEPAMLAELLKDVVGQPGALPVFQYTLTELFDVRVDDRLTVASYGAIGGARGVVSPRADHLYHSMSPEEQDATQQLCLRARRARGAGHLGSTAGSLPPRPSRSTSTS